MTGQRVTPDTPDQGEPRQPRATAVAGGLLGLVAGLVAIITLTRPEPAPTAEDTLPDVTIPPVELPSTTTTTRPFRVTDLVSGPQISWIASESFVGRRVVSALIEDGEAYIFTTNGTGLDAWISDGESKHLGSVDDPGFQPVGVISTGQVFVAYGDDSNERLAIWTSPDGGRWEQSEVPSPGDGTMPFVGAAGTTGEITILTVIEAADPASEAVSRAVSERYPGFDGFLIPDPAGEGEAISIQGPLRLSLPLHRPEDLGLDPESLEAEPTHRLVALIGSSDGRSWRRQVIADNITDRSEMTSIGSFLTGPDGALWARGPGYGDQSATWRTSDGVDWESVDAPLPAVVVPWRGRFVGLDPVIGVLPRLRVSDDLQEWQDLFEPPLLQHHLGWNGTFPPDLAAGPGGIAVDARSSTVHYESATPTLERDGYRLEASPGGTALFADNTLLYEFHWFPEDDESRFRFEDGSIVFLDPSTGDELVSFTMDELGRLDTSWATSQRAVLTTDHHVLFFSPDGESWTIQDVSSLVTGYTDIDLVVGESRILLLATSPNLTVVWTGVLPGPESYP